MNALRNWLADDRGGMTNYAMVVICVPTLLVIFGMAALVSYVEQRQQRAACEVRAEQQCEK